MLLVAIIPALIVAVGVIGFVAQSGIGVENVLLPYIGTYGALKLGDVRESLGVLFTFAPVAIVPILYCAWPNLPEKRHMGSALAVVAMPVYLAIARMVFSSSMQPFVPAVALLAAYVSWLCVVRLPTLLRVVAIVMLAVAVVVSWTQTAFWDDAAWKVALFSRLDSGNLGLRPGV
jgi:hypothetical protein